MSFEEQLRRSFEAAIAEATATAREKEASARDEGAAEGYTLGFEDGRRQGLEAGRTQGAEEGRARGFKDGHARGLEEGHASGLEEGRARGLEEGRAQGINTGFQDGVAKGLAKGREEGLAQGREQGIEQGRADGRREGFDAGRREGFEAARNEKLKSTTPDHVVKGLREIDSARSLSEVLDTLLGCARREASRTALFLVRTNRFRSWRAIGFGALDNKPPFDVDIRQAGVIAEAVRTKALVKSDSSAAAPAFAALPEDRTSIATPIALAGEVVAVLYADDQETDIAGDASSIDPDVLDALARHAARCLESLTAIRTARAMADPRDADGLGEADPDAAARRYAKLLVSEIRMYHENEVAAGWRERDLGLRLRGEIARARGMYEERVPPAVRERADYFNDELVKTLANGDATLLQLR